MCSPSFPKRFCLGLEIWMQLHAFMEDDEPEPSSAHVLTTKTIRKMRQQEYRLQGEAGNKKKFNSLPPCKKDGVYSEVANIVKSFPKYSFGVYIYIYAKIINN